jgi:hypothetical protein
LDLSCACIKPLSHWKETYVEERENLKLEREREINLEVGPKLGLSCACIIPVSHWKETDVEERESVKLEREREI